MRPTWWPVLLVCTLCACESCDARPLARGAQGGASKEDRPKIPEVPPPPGTPVPADKLGAVTPDSLDGFDASGPAEGREVALDNGGKLIGTRRIYRRGSQQLILEISDTLHAPEVRALVTHARGFDRSTPRGSFKGVEVQGHGGVSQWQGPTNAAVTNVLVDGRFMVNVKVRPADSAAPALELANKLLLASLRALAASDAGTAGTAPDARVQEPGGGTKSGGAKPPKASAPAAPKAAPGKTPAPSDDGAQTK